MPTPGHVFVIRGDLTQLSCDAWAVPTDAGPSIAANWMQALRSVAHDFKPRPDSDWHEGRVRARKIVPWPAGDPQPWLLNVGRQGATPRWYAEGVRQFLDAVASELLDTHGQMRSAARNNRARPLVALPLVGTRLGGGERVAGKILKALYPVLLGGAQKGLDVALATWTEDDYAAAQAERRRALGDPWPELDDPLKEQAAALARDAAAGTLVAFFGAGLSAGAGLPTWEALLAGVEATAGLNPADLESLQKLSFADRAAFLEKRLRNQSKARAPKDDAATRSTNEAGRTIGEAVARMLAGRRPSVAQYLLAGLPIQEFVTTNYDDLFQRACVGVGNEVAVLPYAPGRNGSRWLLKLHGCVRHPEDIVLTRQDYLRYEQRRSALGGIVQALLITRRMVFLGFSLTDDNFHRIVDAVRRAIDPDDTGIAECGMGTSITFSPNPVFEELWGKEILFLPVAQAGDSVPTAARRFEIFLDCVAGQVGGNTAHFLREKFDAVLAPEEKELRREFAAFLDKARRCAPASPAWARIEKVAREMGWKEGRRSSPGGIP